MRVVKRILRGGWEWWKNYCAGVPAVKSAAIIRIATAWCLYYWLIPNCARQDYSAFLTSYSGGAYQPWGILALFGKQPPPAWFLDAV